MAVATYINYVITAHRISAAVNRREMVMIVEEDRNLILVCMGVYLTAVCAIAVLVALQRGKKAKAGAAEARAKFAEQ